VRGAIWQVLRSVFPGSCHTRKLSLGVHEERSDEGKVNLDREGDRYH
jgi:hypothetical protein